MDTDQSAFVPQVKGTSREQVGTGNEFSLLTPFSLREQIIENSAILSDEKLCKKSICSQFQGTGRGGAGIARSGNRKASGRVSRERAPLPGWIHGPVFPPMR